MRIETLKSGLIVSCQAPVESSLHDPVIIAGMAHACVDRGACGVRIDSPAHLKATRQQLPDIPIIGLWKRNYRDCSVSEVLNVEKSRTKFDIIDKKTK